MEVAGPEGDEASGLWPLGADHAVALSQLADLARWIDLGAAYDKPLLVLTDEFSTSAGDVFPALLQDAGRGKLFGYRTAGAGGSVAMSRLMSEEGNGNLLMTIGLGVVGSTYSFGVDARPQDATPIAQLIEEQEGVLVPADSPFKTIDDLVQAWSEDPESVVVGGGSSPGGPAHLFPMQLAKAAGIDPKEVKYVTYDGGGPLTSALLGNKIDVGFSGLAE